MIITREPFYGLDCLNVWWPDNYASVYPLLSQTPVVIVRHCGAELAASLKAYAFRTFERYTHLLNDLSLSEEEMWHRVRKTDRWDINRARRMGCQVLVNEETESALQLINDFIRRRRWRRTISLQEWRRMLASCDVFLVKDNGRPIAARVVLVDPPVRAKVWYSATMDRSDPQYGQVIGSLNRFLHWYEITYYKAKGVHWYDLGGVHKFKQSLGGQVVEENSLELAANPLLRSMLRLAVGAKAALARGMLLRAPFNVPIFRMKAAQRGRKNANG